MDLSLVAPPAEALMAPAASSLPVGVGVACGLLIFSGVLAVRKRRATPLLGCIVALMMVAPMVNAYSFGVPLTTTGIGLFCYYNEPTDFTLANTVTAFQAYTDHGTYYDGIVRVYQSAVGTTYTGSGEYADVNIRVRADGWIMAWLNSTQDNKKILYTGAGTETDYWTSLGRAISRIYYVSSKSFPGYDALYYYDYSQPLATRLVYLTMNFVVYYGDLTDATYYIIPNSQTVRKNTIIYSGSTPSSGSLTIAWNGGSASWGASTTIPWTTSTPTITSGTLSYMTASCGIGQTYDSVGKIVVLVWLS